tara:strand:- start:556 stop:1125 length:570 start_codon:yes stop_codon:yes gene_type:complete
MRNLIIVLIISSLYGCIDTVNHQICALYGDRREITDTIYLNDNGIHVDLVLNDIEGYTSYGWGSQHFFINGPTWSDISYKDIIHVLKNKDDVVIRETSYKSKRKYWVPVPLTKKQLDSLKNNISNSYYYYDNKKVKVKDSNNNITYYKAVGEYKYNYTCNSWTNDMLKNSDMYARKHTILSNKIINLYK